MKEWEEDMFFLALEILCDVHDLNQMPQSQRHLICDFGKQYFSYEPTTYPSIYAHHQLIYRSAKEIVKHFLPIIQARTRVSKE